MAKCKNCGKKLGLFEPALEEQCETCFDAAKFQERAKIEAKEANIREVREERAAAIEAVILTTEACPQGMKITQRIEIVTAECAFGMNIFKDLFAGVRDIVGGRSEAVQKTLRDSRRTALYELKREAHAVGANAVIGVDLDYVELSAAASMVLLVASGTAVNIEKSNT